MTKRIIIGVAAAALIAIPAQSASAAISKPVRPLAQEMEHGVAPTVEQGVSTSPGSSEPEAVESIPSPAEQGFTTSPGVTPVTEPDLPGHETQQAEEEEEDERTEEECAWLNDHINAALAMAGMFEALAGAFEGAAGGELTDKAKEWAEEAEIGIAEEYKDGCNSGGGETAD